MPKRILPFIGYAEVANCPTHAHHRYVINFGQREEEECWQHCPDLMAIVREKVKPEREAQNDPGAKEKWWQFIRPRPDLYGAIAGLDRVLVTGAQAAARYAFAFLPSGCVYSSNLNVLAFSENAAFALFQSRVHEVWARFFGSTRKDDFSYTPTTCLETFPFPLNWRTALTMRKAGQSCHDFRAELMVRNNEGLTKTYNRLHDPDERDPEIVKLRELHAAMDRAVLDIYGWEDIPSDCEFLLDYEIDEETWGKRKKPYRYRWPEEVHDEVLARLLDLNERRYAEEVAAGLHAEKGAKASTSKKRTRRQAALSSSKVTLPLD